MSKNTIDPVLGFTAPQDGWVPTPSHVIRRRAVLDEVRKLPPGRLLEIGCGSGALLHDFAALGFRGKAVDSSGPALSLAQKFWAAPGAAFSVESNLNESDDASYDYLMAFEVLEHVPEDLSALKSWMRCLKPNGILIFSVPAHRRMWGAADEWAGHQRRYDEADIVRLTREAGCTPISLRCYGFPLLNVLRPLSNISGKRKMKAKPNASELDVAQATALSGIDRKAELKVFALYSNVLAKLLFSTAAAAQKLFYSTSLGTGYLMVARKTEDPQS